MRLRPFVIGLLFLRHWKWPYILKLSYYTHTISLILWTIDLEWMPAINKPWRRNVFYSTFKYVDVQLNCHRHLSHVHKLDFGLRPKALFQYLIIITPRFVRQWWRSLQTDIFALSLTVNPANAMKWYATRNVPSVCRASRHDYLIVCRMNAF